MPDIEDVQRMADEFDALCQARHEAGAEQYGPFGFLTNPMFSYIYEELADSCNYLRYLFIKIRLLEELANASGVDLSPGSFEKIRDSFSVPSGPPPFVPSEKVSGFLPFEKPKG